MIFKEIEQGFNGMGIKSLRISENSVLAASDRQVLERMKFMDLSLYDDMIRNPFSNNQSMEILGGEIGSGGSESVTSPICMFTSNSVFVEEESGSRNSDSLMESNSPDLSFINLKLGRIDDYGDAMNGETFNDKSAMSSVNSSSPAKRARTMSLPPQTPFCRVHGCNKDLSSSKDYHKRHRVCDVHSKTAKVIVNGIEQRFCQQCSRFHLLAEFDDGKRSCRKRLAGHNERRRKSQFDTYSGKPQKLLQPFQGIFPNGVFYSDRYELPNLCNHVKLDMEPIYSLQVPTPITNGHLLSKSILPLHKIPSSGTEDYSLFNTASTIHDSSGVSNTGSALSLLSTHSQDLLSNRLAEIPMASPMIIQGSHSHYTVGQNFNKPFRVSSSENFTPCGAHLSVMNLIKVDQMDPSDAGNDVDFGVLSDGVFRGLDSLNTKYCLSPEHESTVNLLQLSSHLQRVEQQRNFEQVKQEIKDFCYFPNV